MRVPQNIEFNGLTCLGQVECPATFPGRREVWHCLLQQAQDLLTLCITGSAVVQGLRNQSGEHFGGVSDRLWHLLSCFSQECLVCPPSRGWGQVYSRASLCKGGWGFSVSAQKLCHTPQNSSPSPLVAGKCVQTWPQQTSVCSVCSRTLKPAGDDFQDSCWIWLPCGYVFLPQPCLLLPRPEIIGQ